MRLAPRTDDTHPSHENANERIPSRVHLVGAGGIMMSGIGTILLSRGHTITGSDLLSSKHTARLQELGATIFRGHDVSNLGDTELVVTTAAARDSNSEVVGARERGIPVIGRAEMVRMLMSGRRVLAVAGSHGKTTTTGLLALMTIRGELDPLVLVGGDAPDIGGNARDGNGALAVIEADEYAEAFLQYEPNIALITNIEIDHLDYFGTEERLHAAFRAFAGLLVPDGTMIVCADSPHADALGMAQRKSGANVERYALDVDADWRAVRLRANDLGGYDFTATLHGAELGRISLRIAGRHNVSNALGALAMAMRAGVDFNRAATAASEFAGVDRRFQIVTEVLGITLLDDYAVHPTEVRTTLSAARHRFPGRRLLACFQPHTFSRASYLLEGFRDCFQGLHSLYVLQTYAAREDPDAGMNARDLATQIRAPEAIYVDSLDEAKERVLDDLREGDVFFTIGAGDVTKLGPMLKERLENRR